MGFCTTDNNCGVSFSKLGADGEIPTQSDYDNLNKIANTPLSELVKNNPSLLVFPKVLGVFNDGIEDEEIFNLHGNPEKLEDVRLKTGNVMGFVALGGTELKILSRFSDDQNDTFLQYMLQKVFSINLFDFEQQISKDGALDLLLFSFPLLLKKALAQGIFRQYQTFARNDANVKGVIDVSRHIKQNALFSGKIAYNSRERTFDNAVTELIRHTIEFIKNKPFGKHILNSSSEVKKCVQEIFESTPHYDIHHREKVISQNLKPITHPYFTAYKPLQKLCLAILRHKKIGFGNEKNKAYGILFDGAWLWEEYVWTILKSNGFKHPRNKEQTGAISVWSKNPRYPDFYRGEQIKDFRYGAPIPAENDILDAKYKSLENASISRDDIHQLITYMHILPANRAGLIYPCKNSESIKRDSPRTVFGLGGTITTFGFPIPQSAKTPADFAAKMQAAESALRTITATMDSRERNVPKSISEAVFSNPKDNLGALVQNLTARLGGDQTDLA